MAEKNDLSSAMVMGQCFMKDIYGRVEKKRLMSH